MGYPVEHWEIAAKDAARLQAFYTALFGWTVHSQGPTGYGMVLTEAGSGINGGIVQSDGPSRVTIYVAVPDLQAALDQAANLGGTPVMPPTAVPGGPTIAMCADPEGNLLGFVLAPQK